MHCCSRFYLHLKSFIHQIIASLSTEHRLEVFEAYFENGRPNKALFTLFVMFLSTESTIGKVVKKFDETGSEADVKRPIRASRISSDENEYKMIADVSNNGTVIGWTAIRLLLILLQT